MVSNTDSSITIRLGTADDDPAIAALIAVGAPGNPKADLDVLRWQYRSEEFGPTVTVVAERHGQVVSHYSAISVPVTVDGRAVKAVRGVDGVTAASERGQGVWGRVAQHLMTTLRADGVEVALSNPNNSSRAVLAKRGWTDAAHPRPYALLLDGAALAIRAPKRLPMPSPVGQLAVTVLDAGRRGRIWRDNRRADYPIEVSLVDGIPDDFDEVAAATSTPTGIVRSSRWLRWRYLDHPHRPYHFIEARRRDRLSGLAVVSIRDDPGGRFVQVLNLLATDGPSARALVVGAADYARANQAVGLVGAAPPGSHHDQQLRAAGLLKVPRRLQPRPIHLLLADLTGNRPALASRRWNYSLGDQDHL